MHVLAAEKRPVDSTGPQPVHQSGSAGDKHRSGTSRTGGEGARGVQPQEPRGIEREIADADKQTRTGSKNEPVRNTPPAGAWNDTASD